MIRLLIAAVAFAASMGLCAPVVAQSYELSPIVAELLPSGPRSEQTFRLTNRSNAPIAIDAAIMNRVMQANGQSSDGEPTEDFILMPPQTVVPAQATQTLRLRWIGDPEVASERAFRMRVQQIPVQFDQQAEGGRVTFAFSYVANIYVAPPGAASNVSLTETRRVEVDGTPFLSITLNNSGNKRAVIDKGTVTVTSGGTQLTLEGESEATRALTTQTILAATSRTFLLPWPADLPVGDVSATVDLRYLIR